MPTRGTSEASENNVLEAFERDGVPALIDLINSDPEEAKRWLEKNLQRMHSTAQMLAGYSPPKKQASHDRQSTSQELPAALPTSEEVLEVEGLFTKSSIGNMTDLVILDYVSLELRAVSIEKILGALIAAKLSTTGRKAALIAKLHRMKDKQLLHWSVESRGQDIRATEKGRERVIELRNRVLHPRELDFLGR